MKPPQPQSGTTREPRPAQRVVAGIVHGPEGKATGFRLGREGESIPLEPGHSWSQTDQYKWVSRGLIEEPQSFVVHPDGSLDVNGETFHPTTPEDAGRLTKILNKRHIPPGAPRPSAPSSARESARTESGPADRVHFRVHLDHLGHVMIEAVRTGERTETGLRGLAHLADDGWLIQPESIHVDPLQRHVEIDGHQYQCSPEGMLELEQILNTRYAPSVAASSDVPIEIRENPAASSGFDIHFPIQRAGARQDVKGHLSQELLDLLQDHGRCDILKPGIILRLTPPYLFFRRRSSEGGEEHIPGLSDVKYRGLPAPALQQLFNHPLIRQTLGEPTQAGPVASPPAPPAPERATFNPPPKAPPPAVARVLPPSRPDAEPSAATPPAEDPELASIFGEKDPHRTNEGVFRELAARLHFPVQDLLLDLPRVFTDRRFEVLDFNGEEIGSVLQLRTAHYYGFYLTHIGSERIDLVYACHGTHLEWGTDKCALQPSAGSETIEFAEPALLGLAQDPENHFVFVVTPGYRDWVRPHERPCAESFALFVTPSEWKIARDQLHLIWPLTAGEADRGS